MSEIVVPSSSNSTEKAIDEYYDSTSDNSSDNSSHKGRPWEGAIEWNFFFFKCRMSQFNWLPVVSISFFEVNATCHFLIGLCRFICPGQLPIYSGIPLLPSTFLKFSFLTFLV